MGDVACSDIDTIVTRLSSPARAHSAPLRRDRTPRARARAGAKPSPPAARRRGAARVRGRLARSGTTFLAGAIGAVPGICRPDRGDAAEGGDRGAGRRPEPEAAARIRRILERVRALALVRGARGVEQTPETAFVLGAALRAYPQARAVHVVRDGRDVVCSLLERGWLSADRTGGDDARLSYGAEARFWVEPERRVEFESAGDAARAAWAWNAYVSAARSVRERVLEVRYEALAESAPRIAEHLGIERRTARAESRALPRSFDRPLPPRPLARAARGRRAHCGTAPARARLRLRLAPGGGRGTLELCAAPSSSVWSFSRRRGLSAERPVRRLGRVGPSADSGRWLSDRDCAESCDQHDLCRKRHDRHALADQRKEVQRRRCQRLQAARDGGDGGNGSDRDRRQRGDEHGVRGECFRHGRGRRTARKCDAASMSGCHVQPSTVASGRTHSFSRSTRRRTRSTWRTAPPTRSP